MTRQLRRAQARADAKKALAGFIIVVVTDAELDSVGAALLPKTGYMAVTATRDRVYRYYHVSERTQSHEFKDIDGTPILTLRVFKTLSEAQTWAAEDARQRGILLARKDRMMERRVQ